MRFGQNTLGTFEQSLALLGDLHAAPAALEQRDPEQPFQLAYLFAQRRLADPAAQGRAAEVPLLGDGHGVLEVAQGQAGKGDVHKHR